MWRPHLPAGLEPAPEPYALFGHGFGGLVAYELALRIGDHFCLYAEPARLLADIAAVAGAGRAGFSR